ncbi:HupE/UreJ family protein [Luteolibacter algae]|uniref:HupE/UreJ family protein n=1 Tax=Luteolibacter algae TaxID=454151 RepID=A0ABW5DAH7_9BACT
MNRIALLILIFASAGAIIPAYFASGFRHIFPEGPDHILFLLALFFLTKKAGDLLIQLTLFTLAHSLTLGLSLYGILALPEIFVETAIALSISYVALENLWKDSLSSGRSWMVFGSGLVHGLGFAHSFSHFRPDGKDFIPAIFSFNVGIEFGQIAVIGVAWLLTAAWRNDEKYRRIIAKPASCLIALSGIYWVVQAVAPA